MITEHNYDGQVRDRQPSRQETPQASLTALVGSIVLGGAITISSAISLYGYFSTQQEYDSRAGTMKADTFQPTVNLAEEQYSDPEIPDHSLLYGGAVMGFAGLLGLTAGIAGLRENRTRENRKDC